MYQNKLQNLDAINEKDFRDRGSVIMGAEIKLKKPIKLVVSARNSGGTILAVAKTDTGVASVFWEPLDKVWVASDNSVGDVLAAAPAPASLLMEEEVYPYEAPPNEEIIYLDKHGKKMQTPPTLDLKNFTWKNFFRWLNYIWSEKTF